MKRILVPFLCLSIFLALLAPSSISYADGEDYVRMAEDTVIYNDPLLLYPAGMLPANSIVYANSYYISSSGSSLEVIYCRDYIIRSAYVPLFSAVPLSPAEAADYSALAKEGIIFKTGVSLLNIDDLPDGSANAAPSVLPAASSIPQQAVSPAAADATPAPSSVPTTEPATPTPEITTVPTSYPTSQIVMPALEITPVPSLEQTPEPYSGFEHDAASDLPGSLVRTVSAARIFSDPELKHPLGSLTEGSVVYAASYLSNDDETKVLEIVFCSEYIIRYAYIDASSVRALTSFETEEYTAAAAEYIMFKPGIFLMNVDLPVSSGGTDAVGDPGATVSFSLPAAEVASVPDEGAVDFSVVTSPPYENASPAPSHN